ncbi:hypothetical protein PVAP13_1KG111905 [Panicum virgatum]|uniref:Uncharacterized protein n=1 Tax=Panicum virgatum TaxID=38727 RepID=A0A8T0XPT9_PANVG|nr:hypothetical protein PVAP13_1KG111905 [Panicum virgatum]
MPLPRPTSPSSSAAAQRGRPLQQSCAARGLRHGGARLLAPPQLPGSVVEFFRNSYQICDISCCIFCCH